MPLTTWGHACFDLRVYKITTASRKSEGHKVFALSAPLLYVSILFHFAYILSQKYLCFEGKFALLAQIAQAIEFCIAKIRQALFIVGTRSFCGLTSKVSNSRIRYEGQKISVHFTALFSIVCLFLPRVIAYFALHHPVRYSYAAYPTPRGVFLRCEIPPFHESFIGHFFYIHKTNKSLISNIIEIHKTGALNKPMTQSPDNQRKDGGQSAGQMSPLFTWFLTSFDS